MTAPELEEQPLDLDQARAALAQVTGVEAVRDLGELDTCYRCDCTVLWTLTDAGKRMLVDPPNVDWKAQPNTVVWRDGAGVLRSRSLTTGAPTDRQYLATPHAATCAARGKSLRQARREVLARGGVA